MTMTLSWIKDADSSKYSCITTCLALSRTAYAKDDQSCLAMLNKQLQNMSHGIEHLQLAKKSEVPYLIAYKPLTDEFYIAFRGTENLRTFLPSLLCAGVPNDFQGRVHAGYAQQAKHIPLSPFTRLLKSSPTCRLIFTGHSLGGAIAAMVTSNILFDEQSIGHHQRISCIAFGAPFFTDEKCAAYLNDRFQDRFHFYMNHSDPIPFALCFLHDCLQRLSSSTEVLKCIDWVKTLLNVQQATLTSEDQSIVNALVSNAASSQLFEAREMFKNATCLLRPIFSILKIAVSKYQLFGECYHIVTEKLADSSSNVIVPTTNSLVRSTLASQIVVKPVETYTMHRRWLSMTAESIVDQLTSFYQDHGIRNYIAELHTHIIIKSGLGLDINSPAVQLMSDSTPLLRDFLSVHFLPMNDPNRWSHDVDSKDNVPTVDKHYWSAILTDYPKDKQSNISLQLRGPTACFFLQLQYCERSGITDSSQLSWKDAIRQPACDEDSLSFEIEKVRTSAIRNMLYRCVHHFGTMDLSKIIDPNKFTTSTGLVGRQQQVANFKLVELYHAALSYLLFSKVPTQAIVPAQTRTSNSASDQHRQDTIKTELLLCEKIILTDRKQVEKNLLDPTKQEAKIFKAEVEKIRVNGVRFAELDQHIRNLDDTSAGAETSDFHLYDLTSEIDILPSNSNTVNIITRAIPTLVAMGMNITDNLLVDSFSHSQYIAAGAGVGLGGVAMCAIRLLGGPALLVAVLGIFLAAAIGYGVYRSLLTVIDREYLKMLELIAKSMGVAMEKTRQHPYWLERAISDIYNNTMASYQDIHICDNWKTLFFQHHDLANISDKGMRHKWLSRVKCVHAHFTLRQQMADMLTVGVIGIGKVGKSMLIHKMFGFPTQSGAERTTKIKPYPVSSRFQMLDMPHLTSTYDEMKRSFAHSYTMMNGIIVILDAQQQGDDEQGEGHALRTVHQLSMEGVDVLYCFNKSDILVRDFEEGDKSASSTLSDDEDDGKNNLSFTKQGVQHQQQSAVWSPQTTETKINEFADRYKQFGVQRDQCKLTFFELNERDDNERKRMKKHLNSLGILSGADIRDIWLREFLMSNGFKKESVDQVMQFRYKN